jgi:uncharacterized coiled-coil protein SlyX
MTAQKNNRRSAAALKRLEPDKDAPIFLFSVFPNVSVFAVIPARRVALSMAEAVAGVETTARYNRGMNDETVEQIQTKITFLENAAAELSDVVFRQQREIQALEAQLKAIVERLSGAQTEEAPRPPEHERPPHY